MNHTYTIKEVATRFNISISTIRFYDKKGLLPFVSKNEIGYRVFSESDINFIQTICCLKDTGMPLKDIKNYINYCMIGTDSISSRKNLLLKHKQKVIEQQKNLAENLKEINIKIERYASQDSYEQILAQIKYVKVEKKALHLADPFSSK